MAVGAVYECDPFPRTPDDSISIPSAQGDRGRDWRAVSTDYPRWLPIVVGAVEWYRRILGVPNYFPRKKSPLTEFEGRRVRGEKVSIRAGGRAG